MLQWNEGFGKRAYYGNLERLISQCSPLQRYVGFFWSKIGDDVWEDEDYVKFIKARFPELDLTPYKANVD